MTKDKAHELEKKLIVIGSWKSSGHASSIWTTTANRIRKATIEVLRVSKGYSGDCKENKWWNGDVQEKN